MVILSYKSDAKHVCIVYDSTQSHMIQKSNVMGEHPSLLSGCASTRVYVRKAADGWIFLRSYLGFSYVHTDSS